MLFTKLDDSPMFRKQVQTLEESAESLRERCLKFYKGCRKYTEGLGEGYDGDIAFASSLETFGGGHNDPISVAFGGPVMTKFTIALREIGTYKEVLRSQVEHMLNDRLLQFVDIDLHDVKDARKRFDKASLLYDQAREKYLSLKKGTKADITSVLEDELYSARSSFEQARFNLVTALSNIEAKKRVEFLEAVSGTMDAHLRYFKQGYELLHQMEPYIHQVLAYAQQSRERSNYEHAALTERMQEFKRQIDRESRLSSNGSNESPNGDGIQAVGRSSHKMIEAVMQTAVKGKVQTIRQGYLSKRSSNLRGDWKRRFFVLDSRGMLYYYRKQWSRPSGAGVHSSQRSHGSSEHSSGLLSRWFSSHYHGGVHDEKSVARHTVNLLTSTIKVDADQSDLRFCFRIISPTKNYTLQVRSLTLDVKAWEPSVINLFQSLGNTFVNSIWEELLFTSNRKHEDGSCFHNIDRKQQHILIRKPRHNDPISVKEKFIQAKYAEKAFVRKPRNDQYQLLAAQQIWESVCCNDKKAVYQHIVASNADVNAVYEQTSFNNSLTLAKALLLQEQTSPVFDRSSSCNIGESEQWVSALNSFSSLGASENRSETDESYEGFSLLHLACQTGDIGMIELLLQYGANVNAVDLRMMSPLHHCILRGRHAFTKLLISRGADPHTTDSVGKTPLQYAMETGNIDDEEALVLLEDTNR
ncbi:ADP-ribosylation factor GTPase-activating protein AGD3 isoform X3 [Dendrobium catenatum]|uniref:ADP-ribosylation factor GTPase-activating protein AGD3 isoform X3 n=1 Tax=Dendrobium catenatum TaxID=906689 RepID=UPI0010A06D59|nr:ADP-ribosylation factor GTPase-activating protein AGD3 isoform X3 [Dendrobium catenatum]